MGHGTGDPQSARPAAEKDFGEVVGSAAAWFVRERFLHNLKLLTRQLKSRTGTGAARPKCERWSPSELCLSQCSMLLALGLGKNVVPLAGQPVSSALQDVIQRWVAVGLTVLTLFRMPGSHTGVPQFLPSFLGRP